VSRRTRAIAFGVAALACAGLAAAVASGYRSDVAAQLGPLRRAVVARRTLPRGRPLAPGLLPNAVEVRRVPARFVPQGALSSPTEALGRAPLATVPAGAYLLATQLRSPGEDGRRPRTNELPKNRRPVEIAVAGAAALAAAGGDPVGSRVDVIVTTEPRGASGTGRTYVAAAGVRLVALRRSPGDASSGSDPLSPAAEWVATLALSRPLALKLIEAESYAREIRLIGTG
jgi:Flp pilus assembly protein CpaB